MKEHLAAIVALVFAVLLAVVGLLTRRPRPAAPEPARDIQAAAHEREVEVVAELQEEHDRATLHLEAIAAEPDSESQLQRMADELNRG